MKTLLGGFLALTIACGTLVAQAGRRQVEEGNRLFQEGKFQEALEKYRQAQQENPDSPIIRHNLGDARYKNQQYEEAAGDFGGNLQSPSPDLKARSYYNLGNALFRQGKLEESVKAYQDALRSNPADQDAKFNLELAMEKLKQQQQQKDQQKSGSDDSDQSESKQSQENQKDADQSKQPDKSEESRKNQPSPEDSQSGQPDQKKDQAGREDQSGADQPKDSNESPRQPGEKPEEERRPGDASAGQPLKLSKEQAERLLQALQANRKGLIRKEWTAKDKVRVKKDW